MREVLLKNEEFKDSALGKIPKDWELQPLATITSKIVDGTQFTPNYIDNGVPFLRVTDVQDSIINFNNVKRISLDEHRQLTARCKPQFGDILYSKNGTVGITKVVDWHEEFSIFVSLCLIRPITTLVNSRYLSKTLQSFLIEKQIRIRSKQMTVSNLHLEEIREFLIPIPDLDEQDKITEILDTVDAAIARTSSLITKLKETKAGLLEDLLTRGLDEDGKLRDPEAYPEQFKNSPLGRIPKDWKIYLLEECVRSDSQITYGIVQAGPHVEGGIPYIRTGDMASDQLSIEGLLRTAPNIVASYRRSEVRTGEIVCAIRATVGKVLEVPAELDGANLTQGTARIAPREDINNHYLLWTLRSNSTKHQFDLVIKGTTFSEITLQNLRKIKVALPSRREEQDKIAAILDAHYNRIRTEEIYLNKLKLQKQGLMQDLLTGKVRVSTIR